MATETTDITEDLGTVTFYWGMKTGDTQKIIRKLNREMCKDPNLNNWAWRHTPVRSAPWEAEAGGVPILSLDWAI